jgi:hypothetical protein
VFAGVVILRFAARAFIFSFILLILSSYDFSSVLAVSSIATRRHCKLDC